MRNRKGIGQWPAYRIGSKVATSTAKISLFVLGIFLFAVVSAIVGIFLSIGLNININSDLPFFLGLILVTLGCGVIYALLVLIDVGGISEKTTSKFKGLFDGLEKQWVIALHCVLYFIAFGVIFSGAIYAAGVASELVNTQINSKVVLSESDLNTTIGFLEVFGLLIPVWIALVNIGVRSYQQPDSPFRTSETLSPNMFTSVATFGYIALCIAISFVGWTLLPVVPRLVAYSIIIMIAALSFAGFQLFMLDSRMLRAQITEKESRKDIGYD